MKIFKIILLILSLLFITSCTQRSKYNKKITIATAASAQFVMKELASNFSKRHNVTMDVIIGSSGKLTTQIINGAPYDLFFAANMKYPEVLFEKGKTEGEPFVFANGVPILWSVKEGVEVSKEYLTSSIITRIVIADPKNAPYGEAAIKYFKDLGIYESVEKKIVYGESISQVNEHILNQTAEIGVSAKSIVMTQKLKGKGNYIALGKEYLIAQGAVIIKNDNHKELKQKFVDYIQSEEGIKILERFGYSI